MIQSINQLINLIFYIIFIELNWVKKKEKRRKKVFLLFTMSGLTSISVTNLAFMGKEIALVISNKGRDNLKDSWALSLLEMVFNSYIYNTHNISY